MDSNDATILTEAWQPDHWSIPHVLFFFVLALFGATWRDCLLAVYAWKALEALPWLDMAVAPDALIVDPLEAFYGWLAVWVLRRWGSPGYRVLPLEVRDWTWWWTVMLAFTPLIAQTFGVVTVKLEGKPRELAGFGEHHAWALSFAWALAVAYVCAPTRWPALFTWLVFGYASFYYTAQLIALDYGYNGWYLATWVHSGLLIADLWLLLFAPRPRPPGDHSAA